MSPAERHCCEQDAPTMSVYVSHSDDLPQATNQSRDSVEQPVASVDSPAQPVENTVSVAEPDDVFKMRVVRDTSFHEVHEADELDRPSEHGDAIGS